MARIGLLEDNHRIAKLSAIMLNYAGHDVAIYTEACECLRALSVLDLPPVRVFPGRRASLLSSPLPIDVLILDLHLPTMSGLDVVRFLRSCPSTYTLPLIFCTAATSSEVNRAFTVAPEAVLVEKPFKLQTLISAITRALSRARDQS